LLEWLLEKKIRRDIEIESSFANNLESSRYNSSLDNENGIKF